MARLVHQMADFDPLHPGVFDHFLDGPSELWIGLEHLSDE